MSLLVVSGALGVGLGFIGFWHEFPPRAHRLGSDLLDNVWRTVSLLALQSNVDYHSPRVNWYLAFARPLASVATLGAIYVLAFSRLADLWNRQRLAAMRGHTVVVGLSERGSAFVKTCPGDVAVLDIAGVGDTPRSKQGRVRYVKDDGRRRTALQSVGTPYAARVLILTGDDGVNLQILGQVLACRTHIATPLDVRVRVKNRLLARQLHRDDGFIRRTITEGRQDVTSPVIEVYPFDQDRVAAESLLRDYPLVDLADLRGQHRVHVVVIGWSGFALEFLEQLARLGPYKSFDIPVVDLIVQRPDEVTAQLAAIQPVFLDTGAARDTRDLPPVLALRMHDLDDASGIPTPQQVAAIEPGPHPSVTAVVVTLGSDPVTAAAAMALRERCTILGRWRAPIFVEVKERTPLTDLFDQPPVSPDPADRLIPVGTIHATCALDMLLMAEQAAREFHEAYVETRQADGAGTCDGRDESARPWPQLDQTYRLANKRAVDHLAIKLLSVGYHVSGYPLHATQQVGASLDEVEAMAELEHRSWEIDRILDGWRAGPVRDNRARINEAIGVPYSKLDETLGAPVRAFDRDQIKSAARLLARPGAVTVRREFRVGLLGHNYVSERDREAMASTLGQALTSLFATHRKDLISLFTPLAPGADLILTEAVTEWLTREAIAHRVVVVRTVPPEVVIEEFLPQVARGGVWSMAHNAEPGRLQRDAVGEIQARLGAVLANNSENTIANLVRPGRTRVDWQHAAVREAGYRRANAYLALRCDALVVFFDATRVAGHETVRHGGTAEMLSWVRDPDSMPDEFRLFGEGYGRRSPMVVPVPSMT